METTDKLSGRRRLLDAAVHLAARKRSLGDVGVRELTRAAALSPGAFYRHFANTQEMGEAVIGVVEEMLRSSLGELWQELRTSRDIAQVSLKVYFELAVRHQATFVVCARERYGGSAKLREAMRLLQQGLARDLASALASTRLLGALPRPLLEDTARDVVEHLNARMLDYVAAAPDQQAEIQAAAEAFVQRQFMGAWLQARNTDSVQAA